MNKQKQTKNSQKQQKQQERAQNYDQSDQYQLGHDNKNLQNFNQLPVQQSQSDEGDILEKIDNLLIQNESDYIQNTNETSNKKISKKEMLLNFKINQQQKIIYNLNQANKKLNRRLEQYYNIQRQKNDSKKGGSGNNESSNLNSSSQSNVGFNDQLTEMQGQFTEIETLIQEYKQQLESSQKRWNSIKQQKDEQIESLKKQIFELSQNKQILQSEMQQRIEEVEVLKSKNQELLLEIQSMELQFQRQTEEQSNSQRYYPSNNLPNRNYYQTPSRRFNPQQQFQDYRFNQKIEKQMENMIKKLLKQLSNQRKINNKMNYQIKRLNNQVIELQKKIKHKNDNIYQLQMKIIYQEKNANSQLMGIKSQSNAHINLGFNKYAKVAPLTPTSNKNVSRRYPNQNPRYEGQNRATSPLNRKNKYQQQQVMMQQGNYEIINYGQYPQQTEAYNNYQQTSYQQDYVLTSIPMNNKKTPKIQKPNQTNNNVNATANIKNQILSNGNAMNNNGQQNINRQQKQSNFVKASNNNRKREETINIQNNQEQQVMLGLGGKGNDMGTKQIANQSLPSNKSSRQFLSFTLMQLQQGKISITIKQKIIIISRLIDVYCKKIKTKNYYNLIAEEIQVYNFNQKHPNLIRIRIVDQHSNSSKSDISSTLQDDTQESLLWNMAFIVETLVKEVDTIDRQDLEVDLNLSEIIEEILSKSYEEKISYFQDLSKSLQASVA